MFQRDLDNKAKASYRLTRQTEEPQATSSSSLRHDPLARITGRVGNPGSINAHAAILNRATASRPSQARHTLLPLQRQYGNRYVQCVLDLARKGEVDAEVSPEVERAIQRARGHGQALDSRVCAQMEAALGVDFSGVRVHTGSEADGLNRALSARAFTTGRDIFFRQREYNPGSSGGRKLLAHELTHVVQQSGARVQGRLTVSQPGDLFEQEADRVAEEVMRMPDSEIFGISDTVSKIQKKCAACSRGKDLCSKCEEDRIQRKSLALITMPLIQCENKTPEFEEKQAGLSLYERLVGREIDPMVRLLLFTWIWEDLGLEWYGYNQFLFFRGTRKWYLHYVPFFFRSKAEFEKVEKEFIQKATEPKGVIPQEVFARQARQMRNRVTLSAFQGPLLAVAGKPGTAISLGFTVGSARRCLSGDVESCVSLVESFALNLSKGLLAQ